MNVRARIHGLEQLRDRLRDDLDDPERNTYLGDDDFRELISLVNEKITEAKACGDTQQTT